jgi:DNA-binding CsgD family transcriptional regulator
MGRSACRVRCRRPSLMGRRLTDKVTWGSIRSIMTNPAHRFDELTEVQRRLLRKVAEGQSSKEMSRDFGLEPRTIDVYLSRAGRALGFPDRQAAAAALVEYEAAMLIRCISTSEGLESPAKSDEPHVRRTVNDQLARFHLPPLGGSENDYDIKSRALASAKVAGAVFLVMVALILGITMLFWAFSLIKL